MLVVGTRVVRGPDWKWGSQDRVEGQTGTVIEVGRPGSQRCPDKTVFVCWDHGLHTNYRVGYEGKYDLRVLDNAPAGVKHPNIICNSCSREGIYGMRFKCSQCYDYDLCMTCYMGDKHNLDHIFQRFDTTNAIGVELSPRKGSVKVTSQGIFVGAKIVRGKDWEWKDQDGGEGKAGRVLDVRPWIDETGRSVVNVAWGTGFTNIYRVGHKGKVDVYCVEPADGPQYYRDHLPILGENVAVHDNEEGGGQAQRHLSFSVGDKVKVVVDSELLKGMQQGHGGWNPRMEQIIGSVGQVHRVTDKGDIRVCYEEEVKWTLNPCALAKVHAFALGDIVQIERDLVRVKHLQKGHGEWIKQMVSALGKMGKVTTVYSDGDLRVEVEGQTWTLNPLSVRLLPGSTQELDNILATHSDLPSSQRDSMLAKLMAGQLEIGETMTPDKLVKEAAQGHMDVVKDYLTAHPDKVDCKSGSKTCLQVASHEGHTQLVCWLLSVSASVSVQDDEGDSPLHYAAFGNQPQVMEQLLENGADVNAVNNNLCSALHVSVSKRHIVCVKVLLKYNCNINLQDIYGDTGLHDAIGNDFGDAVELLANLPGVDFTLKNKRGFNPLHHAALKGNTLGAEKVIQRARQLVDVKKEDGFSALHLASLNGHRAIADTLLSEGRALIDITNNKKQTPLMLAVSQGHASVVELLVSCEAGLALTDEDGDTSLHMVLIKRSTINTEISELEAPTIFGIWQEIGGKKVENSVAVAIACYLVQEGASLQAKNKKELTPLDLVKETHIPNLLNRYLTQQPVREKMEERRPVECTVCSELSDGNTILEPCGHRVACEDCSSRLKKCLLCSHQIITRRTPDGRIVAYKSRQPSAESLRYLETKIAEIEEVHCCSICMERRKNVAFLCGHGACQKCSATLRTCHMCRKTITKKINLY